MRARRFVGPGLLFIVLVLGGSLLTPAAAETPPASPERVVAIVPLGKVRSADASSGHYCAKCLESLSAEDRALVK